MADSNRKLTRRQLDIATPPEIIVQISEVDPARYGIWSKKLITMGSKYGPFAGEKAYEVDESTDPAFVWEIVDVETKEFLFYIDATNPKHGNWMRYVNCARYFEEQNIVSKQEGIDIYYHAIKDIHPGEELLTWFEKSPLKRKKGKKKILHVKKVKPEETASEKLESISMHGRRRKVNKYWQQDIKNGLEDTKLNISDEEWTMKSKESAPPTATSTNTSISKNKKILNETEKDSSTVTPKKAKCNSNTSSRLSSAKYKIGSTVNPDNFIDINDQDVTKKLKTKRINKVLPNKTSKFNKVSTNIELSKSTEISNEFTGVATSTSKASPIGCSAMSFKETVGHNDENCFQFELRPDQISFDNDGNKSYHCEICLGNYKHTFSLKRHYFRNHINPIYISKIDSIACGVNIEENISSRKDIETVVSNEPRSLIGLFRCNVCYDLFDDTSSLKAHLINHPEQAMEMVKEFTCEHCNMKFKHKQNLLRHEVVHTGLKSFACNHCDKKFPTLTNKQRHERIHKGQKFTCTQCPGTFTQTGDLKKHMSRQHPETYNECSYCSKYFPTESNLETHVKKMHGKCLEENKERAGLKNKTKKLLLEQDRAESRGLATSVNGNLFLSPSASLTHCAEEMLYACTVCGKHFLNYSNMCRHRRLAHSKDSKPADLWVRLDALMASDDTVDDDDIASSASSTTSSTLAGEVNQTSTTNSVVLQNYLSKVSANIKYNVSQHMEGTLNQIKSASSLIKWKQKTIGKNKKELSKSLNSEKSSPVPEINFEEYNFPAGFKFSNTNPTKFQTDKKIIKLNVNEKNTGLYLTNLSGQNKLNYPSIEMAFVNNYKNSEQANILNNYNGKNIHTLNDPVRSTIINSNDLKNGIDFSLKKDSNLLSQSRILNSDCKKMQPNNISKNIILNDPFDFTIGDKKFGSHVAKYDGNEIKQEVLDLSSYVNKIHDYAKIEGKNKCENAIAKKLEQYKDYEGKYIPVKNRKFVCLVCHHEFYSKVDILEHQEIMHTNVDSRHIETDCDYSVSTVIKPGLVGMLNVISCKLPFEIDPIQPASLLSLSSSTKNSTIHIDSSNFDISSKLTNHISSLDIKNINIDNNRDLDFKISNNFVKTNDASVCSKITDSQDLQILKTNIDLDAKSTQNREMLNTVLSPNIENPEITEVSSSPISFTTNVFSHDDHLLIPSELNENTIKLLDSSKTSLCSNLSIESSDFIVDLSNITNEINNSIQNLTDNINLNESQHNIENLTAVINCNSEDCINTKLVNTTSLYKNNIDFDSNDQIKHFDDLKSAIDDNKEHVKLNFKNIEVKQNSNLAEESDNMSDNFHAKLSVLPLKEPNNLNNPEILIMNKSHDLSNCKKEISDSIVYIKDLDVQFLETNVKIVESSELLNDENKSINFSKNIATDELKNENDINPIINNFSENSSINECSCVDLITSDISIKKNIDLTDNNIKIHKDSNQNCEINIDDLKSPITNQENNNFNIPKNTEISLNLSVEKSFNQKYVCTKCKQEFISRSKMHEHITDCGDYWRNLEQRISWVLVLRGSQLPVGSTPNSKVGNTRKRGRPVQQPIDEKETEECAKRQLQKMLIQQHVGENDRKSIKLSLRRKSFENMTTEEDVTSPTKNSSRKRSFQNEIPGNYDPGRHMRRRRLGGVTLIDEIQKCGGCGDDFQSIVQLERHIPVCSHKEKVKELHKTDSSNSEDDTFDPQKLTCIYCIHQFTYARSLRKHVFEFCQVRKELLENHEPLDLEWEGDLLVPQDSLGAEDGKLKKKRKGLGRGLSRSLSVGTVIGEECSKKSSMIQTGNDEFLEGWAKDFDR